MLYTATSRALACLETVVHLGDADLPLNRYLVEVVVPDADWESREVFDPAAHVGWDAGPAGMVSLDWGTAWATSGRTLLAEVPSVIVPEEANILINPAHPSMAHVRVRKVRRWLYDARLFAQPPRRRLR
jgi:RES domain-containing protein